jgi:hypothetical protein
MTPAAALTAIVARANTVSGLVEAKSPLGVRNSSSPRINRSFSIRPGGLSLAPASGRGRVDSVGVRVRHSFSVELCHQLKPSAGQEAPSTALSDIHNLIKALIVQGTTLTTDANLTLGGITTEYPGSGAYYLQTLTLDVEYYLALGD